MGKGANHRQKEQRKGKAKERARRKTRTQHGHEQPIEWIVDSAVFSSLGPEGRPRPPRAELLECLADRQELSAAALAQELMAAVTEAWHRHWQPADVPRALAHNCGTPHAQLGAEAVLRELRTYQPGSLPPRWDAQMDAIDPGTDSLDLDDTAEGSSWAAPVHHLLERRLRALAVAVETIAFLRGLPRLPKIGPLPGEPVRETARDTAHVDPSVLHRVTSLLAKAESTSFPQEAEALTAKAQELMTRHAIDMVLIESKREGPTTPLVTARRIGIDDPYASPKAILLQTIASANRCRSVWSKDLAFATVFGDETDLDTVELLYTSLLVQSARAMIADSPPGRSNGGRTRSFRQSFLVSFAHRIGDRLREAVASAVRAATDEQQSNLLPVLADRESATQEACQAAFPATRTTTTAANNAEGWQAGRRAADRAQLGLHDTVGQGQEQTVAMALQPGRS